MTPGMTARNRVLLALACADALGAATEFKNPRQIQRDYPNGIYSFESGSPFGFAAGEATDDTQMTVALVHALNRTANEGDESEGLLSNVVSAFHHWLESSPPDVGNLTRSALRKGGLDGGYRAWANTGSAGNGGLMRVAGVFIAGVPYESQRYVAAMTTALTHIDPRCVLASIFFSELLYQCNDGHDLSDAIDYALDQTLKAQVSTLRALVDEGVIRPSAKYDTTEQFNEQRAALGREYAGGWPSAVQELQRAISEGRGGNAGAQGGFVLDTLQAALAHNVNCKDWAGVASAAAMLGNDSDTAGAVAGALAGARGWKPGDELAYSVRIGAEWATLSGETVWRRDWRLADHIDALVLEHD